MPKFIQSYWPPFFVIALVCIAAVLNGCSVQPAPLSAAPAETSTPVFATLADANNPVEMAAAPVVTRLAIYTHTAAKALRDHKISVDQAKQVRANEKSLRVIIERAIAAGDLPAIHAASLQIDDYIKELRAIQ